MVTFADVAQLDWAKVPDPLKYYKLGALIVGGLIVLLLAIFLVKNLFSDSTPEQQPVKPAIEQVQKPVAPEQPSQPEQEAPSETTTEGETTAPPSSESQESAKEQDDEIIDFRGTARQNREKREAAERARQQKAKEQQKQKEQKQKEQQKEQQKQEDSKQPSEGNSSKKEYKPEMI